MKSSLLVRRALLLGAALLIGGCADSHGEIAGLPSGAPDGQYPQFVVLNSHQPEVEVRLLLRAKPAGVLLGS